MKNKYRDLKIGKGKMKKLEMVIMVCAIPLLSCNKYSAAHSNRVNAEAERMALNIYQDWYTKCGDDYFEYDCHQGPNDSIECIYYQYKGVKVLVDEAPLDAADNLNEIKWRGSFEITYDSYRFAENEKWGNWTGAASNLGEGRLVLKKGSWNFERVKGSKKIKSCESIPK